MAVADFMHSKLISGAGKDALTHIGMGAGAGAAVGAVNGEFSDTGDGLVRGALQGAMLGAAGGAASRKLSSKYAKGFSEALDKGPMEPGSFKTSYFSNSEKTPFMSVDEKLFGEAGSLNGYKHTPAPSGEAARQGTSDLPSGNSIVSGATSRLKQGLDNMVGDIPRAVDIPSNFFERPGIDRQALRENGRRGLNNQKANQRMQEATGRNTPTRGNSKPNAEALERLSRANGNLNSAPRNIENTVDYSRPNLDTSNLSLVPKGMDEGNTIPFKKVNRNRKFDSMQNAYGIN